MRSALRTDVATRLIPAPPEQVFAAMIDPGALIQWLPPEGMTGRFEHFDARPGGSYRLVLTYRGVHGSRGKSTVDSDVVEARFLEVVPDARVVHAVDFVSDDPAYSGTMIVRWELAPSGGGTRVEIRAEHVPPGISAEDHAAGLASSLENLARYVDGG